MIISRVPLACFYERLLPTAKAAGYKIVITILAREADAPLVYEDVKRYWSSLHDVTGRNIMFLFAGPDADQELGIFGLQGDEEGHKEIAIGVSVGGDNQAVGELMEGNLPAEEALRPSARLPVDSDVAIDQTLELTMLRDYLGVSEDQIPCLVFTLLRPKGPEHKLLPFSIFADHTIYSLLKSLVAKWSGSLYEINTREKELKEFPSREPELKLRLSKLATLRDEVRRSLDELKANEARDAAEEILRLTAAAGRGDDERRECYKLFGLVKKDHPAQVGVNPLLMKLIGRSFDGLLHHFEVADEPGVAAVHASAMRSYIGEVGASLEAAWDSLEIALSHPDPIPAPAADKWDYFIAYSSLDGGLAEFLFGVLSRIGRPFLDRRYLKPGDRWPEKLRSAQNNSQNTVILVTKNTPASWFNESEYLHAVDLMRQGRHRVIPVYSERNLPCPYGLEQVHSVTLATPPDRGQLLAQFVGIK